MKYMRIRMSGIFLIKMMTQGIETKIRCIKGLPEGTQFKYIIPDIFTDICLVVEHESFKELKDGDEIPIHEFAWFKNID